MATSVLPFENIEDSTSLLVPVNVNGFLTKMKFEGSWGYIRPEGEECEWSPSVFILKKPYVLGIHELSFFLSNNYDLATSEEDLVTSKGEDVSSGVPTEGRGTIYAFISNGLVRELTPHGRIEVR